MFKNSKKLIISLLFGLIGFLVNFVQINIPNVEGLEISILMGLLFPLIITLAWGWKYGLIASLFGGCQTMWFLWYADGYGMLYSVPIFTLWIVFHGVIADLRNRKQCPKWYYNKYIAEVFFRIISSLGLITIFRWLISLNPPFWAPDMTTNFISYEWLELIIKKQIIGAFIFLLVADAFLRLKRVKRIFGLPIKNTDSSFILIISLLFGVVMWAIQSFVLMFFENKEHNSFLDHFIYNVESNTLLLRIVLIIALGFIGYLFMSLDKNNKVQKVQLQEHNMKIDHILNLTAKIGKAKDMDEKKFMSDLLQAAIEIIPEADYGAAYIYEDGYAIPVSVVGHDENALIGLRYKDIITPNTYDEVFIIKDFKNILLEHSDGEMQNCVRKYIKDAKESMWIILTLDNEKIASINLDIAEHSDKSFDKQSIDIAKALKNIPAAFFTQIRDYETKQDLYQQIIMSIMKMLSLHNAYTKEHCTNVAKISSKIASDLGYSKREVDMVYWTGLVHDIGKILIRDDILEKKGKLTDEEYEIIKMHPVWGHQTLDGNQSLSEIAKYVLHHHERWDGKGYPTGLSGEDIPLVSRIIAVADTYDAMTSDRPYRKALSEEIAINEIVRNYGLQFDPKVAKAFVEVKLRGDETAIVAQLA